MPKLTTPTKKYGKKQEKTYFYLVNLSVDLMKGVEIANILFLVLKQIHV